MVPTMVLADTLAQLFHQVALDCKVYIQLLSMANNRIDGAEVR